MNQIGEMGRLPPIRILGDSAIFLIEVCQVNGQ